MEDLRTLIDEAGLKHVFIAGKLGISRAYLSQMLSNTKPMNDDIKREIKRLCMKMVA